MTDAEEPYEVCYGCGQQNASGLRLKFDHPAAGRAECVYTAEEHFAGAPGVIHGGVQAAMLDEAMGHAIHFGEVNPDLDVVTVEFSLRYRRPAPVAVPLTLRGRLLRSEGWDYFVAGEILSQSGELLTTAESRWRRVQRRETT